jgi:hypothetical protein
MASKEELGPAQLRGPLPQAGLWVVELGVVVPLATAFPYILDRNRTLASCCYQAGSKLPSQADKQAPKPAHRNQACQTITM